MLASIVHDFVIISFLDCIHTTDVNTVTTQASQVADVVAISYSRRSVVEGVQQLVTRIIAQGNRIRSQIVVIVRPGITEAES